MASDKPVLRIGLIGTGFIGTVHVEALLRLGVPVVGVLGWLATGPSQPGWAAKAGTPTTASSKATDAAAAGDGSGADSNGEDGGPAPTTAVAGLTPPFTADYAGTVKQDVGGSTTTITIDGTLSGAAAGELKIVLHAAGQGVNVEYFRIGPPPEPEAAPAEARRRQLKDQGII